MSALIYFSDKSTVEINENETIIPIVATTVKDEPTASMGKPISVYRHVHNGFIPSLMEIFCNCDYFYIDNDYSTAYCCKSIVKIKTDL